MTASRYDNYGIVGSSLAEARVAVEEALGLELSERDSSYYSGTYFSYRLDVGRGLMLYRNFDPHRSTWIRAAYTDYPLVLEVSALPEMDEIQKRLMESGADITYLDSESIADDDNSAP